MKVLVPLDGSTLAEAAIPAARKQVETCGGEIILISIGELAETSEHRSEEHAALRHIVDPVAERLSDLHVTVRTDMGGDVVEAIVRTAADEAVDQIVMSTHGRSGLSRYTHGSVADGVLRRSPVPVLLVRPGGAELDAQRALLETPDCAQFVAAALSLHRSGAGLSVEQLDRLGACIEELPEREALTAAEAYLAELPDDRRRSVAVGYIEHGSAILREAALDAAPGLGEEAIPALTTVAGATEHERRWTAYQAIRRIGGSPAIAPLIEALHSDDVAVRWVGSDGLTEIGPRVVPDLLRALAISEPKMSFHRAALRVLRRTGLPGHEASLQRLLTSLGHFTTVVQTPPLAQELLREVERGAAPVD